MSAKLGNAWLFCVVVVLTGLLLVLLYRNWRPSRRQGQIAISVPQNRVGDRSLYPPEDVPGAVDPRVTQENIYETICVKGYTAGVRPPSSATNRLKREHLREDGLPGTLSDYELDHFIPLELGGCPDCATNLWMEPWSSPGAHEKDVVENYLHREVCEGHISLTNAQGLIVRDWYAVYQDIH